MIEVTLAKPERPTHRFTVHDLELQEVMGILALREIRERWFSCYMLQLGAADLTMAAPGVTVFGSPEHYAECQRELYGADD